MIPVGKTLDRRTFLRGVAGATLSLPFLDAMAVGSSARVASAVPMRMVCVGVGLGFVPKRFFPEQTGRNYALPDLLKPLARHRDDFTVFSQLDHGTEAQGGHGGVHAYLTGILSKHSGGLPEANISIDQKAAQHVGVQTRYPSLTLGTSKDTNNNISWSSAGVALPQVSSLHMLFSLLFERTDPNQVQSLKNVYTDQISVLDLVKTDADRLMRQVGVRDKEKLDRYFTSVREVEKRLSQSRAWLDQPKPTVDYELPVDADGFTFSERIPLYYDLMALALETDSTRIVTFSSNDIGHDNGGLGVTRGYHQLTHHGKVASYIEELMIIERFHTTQFARFLDKLKAVQEPNGKTLFDNTMSLIGSGMGNASSHSNKDLPLLLAGGGFRHGEHRLYAKDKGRGTATPAANLFVSMLQRFGMELDQFSSSTGTLTGLEVG